MLKIAVVGTGLIGKHHLHAIEESEECMLCAVCDINREMVAGLAERFGVPYFTDYREIVSKTEAEAVILNLPHWLHCEVTEYFLHHKIHVLVEKPMANSVKECDRMILAEKESGKKFAIGHIQRFFMANRKVKEIYESGELGKLCMFHEIRTVDYFLPDRPKWFWKKELAGGGIVMNYGAHMLDKLFYILEEVPIEIRGITGNCKNDKNIEGHAQIFLSFPSDVSATITFSGYGSPCYESVYYFTEGTLKVVNYTEVWIDRGSGWEKITVEEDNKYMKRQLESFCKYIKGEPSEIVTSQYARDIIRVIEKVYGKED